MFKPNLATSTSPKGVGNTLGAGGDTGALCRLVGRLAGVVGVVGMGSEPAARPLGVRLPKAAAPAGRRCAAAGKSATVCAPGGAFASRSALRKGLLLALIVLFMVRAPVVRVGNLAGSGKGQPTGFRLGIAPSGRISTDDIPYFVEIKPMALVYIVEDDPDTARRVRALLTDSGHQVEWFDTPHKFFYQLSKHSPALALVDWMLPEMTGIDVVLRLRQQLGRAVGVLMLTAMDSEQSVVTALQAGADDYVVKPGADAVLLARVQALLRRSLPAAPLNTLALGPYRFDYALQLTHVHEQVVDLAPREFDLAWTLFSQPSRLFTKDELQAAIWGKGEDTGHHTITQHVYLLRKKLALADHSARLVSVYASGYRLEVPTAWTTTRLASV
jgi:two-component system, OmpR family, response regulator RegX3